MVRTKCFIRLCIFSALVVFGCLTLTSYAEADISKQDSTNTAVSEDIDRVMLLREPNYQDTYQIAQGMIDFDEEKDQEIIEEAMDIEEIDLEESFSQSWLSDLDFEISTETYWFRYEEPDVMEDEGLFFGIAGSATSRGRFLSKEEAEGDDVARLELSVAFGQVDYSSETTGTMDDVDDWTFEVRGLIGHEWMINSDRTTILPFTGVAYRYLNDDSGGRTTTTNHGGYQRESNYFYTPFGVEIMTDMSEEWSAGLSAEYDLFWFGKQKSHLGDAVAGLATLENDQKKGYGYRVSFKLKKEGEEFDIIFEPYYHYWDIEKSEEAPVLYSGVAVGYGWEPKNNTQQYGLKTSVYF